MGPNGLLTTGRLGWEGLGMDPKVEEKWRAILVGEDPVLRWGRKLWGKLPAKDRCKNCLGPLSGAGRIVMTLFARQRYSRNPRFCSG